MREFKISDKYSTADIGLEVKASSIEGLFLAAAEGMMAIIFGRPLKDNPEIDLEMEFRAPDREQLLVDWLSELIYNFDTDGWIPVKIELKYSNENGYCLRARVGFRRYKVGEEEAEHEIKAVTYHQLNILEEDGMFSCHLVFDL